MKYESKITIEASLAEVMTKLLKKENMKLWMKGFKSYELEDGKFFQENSKAVLTIDTGVKQIEMKELILESDLPFYYKASYEAQGVINMVSNTFEIIDDETTLWTQVSEFKFKSIAVKAFAQMVVSLFKNISQSTLNGFKEFVEAEN